MQRIQRLRQKIEIVAAGAEPFAGRGEGGDHAGEKVVFRRVVRCFRVRQGKHHIRNIAEEGGKGPVRRFRGVFLSVSVGKVRPEHVEPVVVQLIRDIFGPLREFFPEMGQKLRLEVFPVREQPAARVHFDEDFLGRVAEVPHAFAEEAHGLFFLQPPRKVGHVAEGVVHLVQHDQHGRDGGVVPPCGTEPALIFDEAGNNIGVGVASQISILNEFCYNK